MQWATFKGLVKGLPGCNPWQRAGSTYHGLRATACHPTPFPHLCLLPVPLSPASADVQRFKEELLRLANALLA